MPKKKILIIDDEQSIARLLKFALEKTGAYEVSGESDSTKALDVIRASRPNLLILDMNMPGVGGVEIAETLKKDPFFKGLPVIFLTGNISDEESEAGLLIDGYPALAKPINMERLLERIQKSLE